MPTLEATLSRLATTFTVRDIMVAKSDLICAVNSEEAQKLSVEHPEFDVIPIRQDVNLTASFERKSQTSRAIAPGDLISDGTSLLDLVEIFEGRHFSFILSRHKIEGFVHFSDLNHELVKLSFYVILEALERMARQTLQSRLDPETLEKSLAPQRYKQIQKLYGRTGDAAQSLANYLNISDVLQLATKAGTLTVDQLFTRTVKEVRDGAAHVTENLVSNYDDVKKLASVKRGCLDLMGTS